MRDGRKRDPEQEWVGPDLPSLSGVVFGSILFMTGGMLMLTVIGAPVGILLFASGLGWMLTPKDRRMMTGQAARRILRRQGCRAGDPHRPRRGAIRRRRRRLMELIASGWRSGSRSSTDSSPGSSTGCTGWRRRAPPVLRPMWYRLDLRVRVDVEDDALHEIAMLANTYAIVDEVQATRDPEKPASSSPRAWAIDAPNPQGGARRSAHRDRLRRRGMRGWRRRDLLILCDRRAGGLRLVHARMKFSTSSMPIDTSC